MEKGEFDMAGISAFEMIIGFAIMNAFIVLFVYGAKEIISLKRDINRTKEQVSRNYLNYLKERLSNGEFNRPEYDDLRLYVLNDQLAHGEIDRPEYEDLHNRIVH